MAGAENPRRRERRRGWVSRLGSWLGWWVVLTGLWVGLDWSVAIAELLVGTVVAAVSALMVELVEYQTDTFVRVRLRWLLAMWRVPWWVVRDTGTVVAVLWRRVVHGEQPCGGFNQTPCEWFDNADDAVGMTRRALLTVAKSVAPNSFVVGIDEHTGVVVTHYLVLPKSAVPVTAAADGEQS